MNSTAQVILTIEDNPLTQKIVRLTLGNEGFTVIEAGTAAEALALASAAPPDLILQDLLLPDMDGFELVGKLNALPNLVGVPVIAFSGFLSRLEHGRAAAAGFTDFIPKPIEPSRLVQVVRAHLRPDDLTPEQFGKGRRLIIADDDPVQLKLARIRLVGLGFEVTTATNGEEALEALEQRGADAVVSDVLMPRMDGFDLCVAMRQDARFLRVPLVLVSSNYVEEADRRLARNAGATAFVVRTPDLADTIKALRTALNAPTPEAFVPVHSDPATRDEHHERILRQLERQSARNVAFAYESSMHASMLSVVAGVSEALTKQGSAEDAAPDILASLLEASGIRMGALFVRNAAAAAAGAPDVTSFRLGAHAGFAPSVADDIEAFFGHPELLERAITLKAPLVVSADASGSAERDLLARAGMHSALLVPCVADEECLGLFLLASTTRDLTEHDWIPFARTISVQIGQALALSRAFATLAASEGHYRLLFATNPLPMWIYDRATLRFLEVNDAAIQHYGYARHEFLGMTIENLRSAEDVATPPSNTGKPPEVLQETEVCRHRLESGQTIEVNVMSHAIALAGRSAVLVVAQDITERKRAEEKILEHARLSALGAAVGLSLTDADSLAGALQQCAEALVTHLDAAFARIWTLNERDGVLELQASAGLYTHLNGLHGKVPVGQFKIGRIARDRKPHLTNRVIGDPEVNDQEWARREGMIAFAGHPLIVNERVVGVMALFARHALSPAVGSALASVAGHIALGIERHRAAEALRIKTERMAFTLEAASVGIWDQDFTTGAVRWSETLEVQHGLRPGEFGGTFEAFIERMHPDDRESAVETIAKARQIGGDFSVEYRTFLPDGTVRWIRGTGRFIVGPDGEPVRAIGITLDVTERRTLEEQFHQAQKMEAVGRLAGGVAHDFNNLLTAILCYCDLVLAETSPGDQSREDIEEIQKAGNRAARLTSQLLAFSRKQIIEPTLLDLNDIVSDLREMLGRIIGEDVKIVPRLRPDVAPVKADRGQIEQVLLNLAVNARDAMPTGGTLTIETENVALDEHYAKTHMHVTPGPHVALTVADTGIGMTPEVQARLFEPFFTTKAPGKGTGLGLATVYGIVTRCGGNIGVYSEEGRGTVFKVYFPRADVSELVATDAAPIARAHVGSETVLVVEDEGSLRELARRLLHQQGYTVLTASSAVEARRLFEENPTIDLLVTDVVMPGASGPELTRQLIADRPALKVIYMSGYTEDAIVEHGVVKPGVAFLNKPFTSRTLGEKIRQVLEM